MAVGIKEDLYPLLKPRVRRQTLKFRIKVMGAVKKDGFIFHNDLCVKQVG